MKNKIVLSKGGTKQRTVKVSEIIIPDLWHIAMSLEGEDRKKVLECWHLAHDMLNAIRENVNE